MVLASSITAWKFTLLDTFLKKNNAKTRQHSFSNLTVCRHHHLEDTYLRRVLHPQIVNIFSLIHIFATRESALITDKCLLFS